MKESPQSKKLEAMLRSSKLVAGGFLGTDNRSVSEIIETDRQTAAAAGYSTAEIARRMQEITDIAVTGLGNFVRIDEGLEAMVEEAKGSLVCPWPHPGTYAKRVTILRDTKNQKLLQWSDLNIHMIAEHGFFEGRGSTFRLEPDELADVIF
ncbi:hypothetical protein SMSP2_00274 [Limihaloglobus sulfuriphilus]|uniref:Uncharacterized protein n=1 Tax=Limihaloglobus sulfuriphilus TaxID=1851148 RepID=A0A1Q2MBA5_9BACT|nr:hypothetical protein [Limihaloglobus sulfuriphilus]AQQ69940.1 hypothetical protein SMSP2_00274 [Limihaloglobus sulfuriphilus]